MNLVLKYLCDRSKVPPYLAQYYLRGNFPTIPHYLVLYYQETVLDSFLVWYCNTCDFPGVPLYLVLHYQATFTGFLLFGAAIPGDCPVVPPFWCCITR